MESQAVMQTASARRYLGQFCKHFAHKLPVVLAETNEAGEVEFGTGTCKLQADDAMLNLRVEAPAMDKIIRLQDIVERHLVRFAFQENLVVNWQVPAAVSQ